MGNRRSRQMVGHRMHRIGCTTGYCSYAHLVIALVLAISFGALLGTVSAAVYYVDSVNGNDANDGSSPEEAWKTLERAYHPNTADPNVDAGDTVYLMTGTYAQFHQENPTPPTDWIKYISYPGERPVIQGINYWYSSFSDCYLEFNDVDFTGGTPATNCVYFGRCNHYALYDCNIIGDGFEPGDECHALQMKLDANVVIENVTITGTGSGIGEYDVFGRHDGTNHGIAFDHGINCDTAQDTNNNNVLVNNCTVEGCDKGIHIWGNNWTVQNCTVRYMTTDGIVVEGCLNAGGEHGTIQDNHIYGNTFWTGWSGHPDGIQFEDATTSHMRVWRNRIHDISGNGMFLRPINDQNYPICADWDIADNLIYDIGYDPNASDYAMQVYSCSDVNVRGNTIIGFADQKGQLLVKDEMGGTFVRIIGNVVEWIDVYIDDPGQDVNIIEEDYNVIYREWAHMGSHEWGPHTTVFGADNRAGWLAVFANYDANTVAGYTPSAASIAIDQVPLASMTSTDLLGNSRIDLADIGNSGSDYVDIGAIEKQGDEQQYTQTYLLLANAWEPIYDKALYPDYWIARICRSGLR